MKSGPNYDYDSYDHAVVQRVIEGRRPPGRINPVDAARVVRVLAGRKYADGQIGYLLGMSRRTVYRIRARHGIPNGWPGYRAPQDWVDAPTRRDRG